MLGVHDFIGYYDWTFEYLRRTWGEEAVLEYWRRAIAADSQQHARRLILDKGFVGMEEYWSHTLTMEEAGYVIERKADYFRIDMHACPSKGFLIARGLSAYRDYCEHCMGWIKPIMDEAGFLVAHEHNHAGQCWWEMYRPGSRVPGTPPPLRGTHDVRRLEHWRQALHHLYLDSVLNGGDGCVDEGEKTK